MEEMIRTAMMCEAFTEYNKTERDKNPYLQFGDGECPFYKFVIHEETRCPQECEDYRGLK